MRQATHAVVELGEPYDAEPMPTTVDTTADDRGEDR
jgi:hypothetical protein